MRNLVIAIEGSDTVSKTIPVCSLTQDRTSRVMRSCLKSNLNIFVLQIRQVLGDALLWALQEMLNTECTNQVIEAWKELFKFITRPMLSGVEGDVF